MKTYPSASALLGGLLFVYSSACSSGKATSSSVDSGTNRDVAKTDGPTDLPLADSLANSPDSRDVLAQDDASPTRDVEVGDSRTDAPGVEVGPDASLGRDGFQSSDVGSVVELGSDTLHAVDVQADLASDRSDASKDSGLGVVDTSGEAGAVAESLQILSYRVLDAEYSTALDAIVMISDSPDRALHVYYPATGIDTRVALPLSAVAVSVAPDGTKAAVAHDAHLSYVDLTAGTLIKTCEVSSDAIDVVLAGNGWAYVFPATDQWCAIHGIRLSDCSESDTSDWAIYAGTVAKLHPSGTKMYGATRGLSPDNLERYDTSSGAPVYGYESPYWGDYSICGDLWMSADGLRIFTACGHAFRSSDTKSQDMTYNGSLEGVSSIRHLYHASVIGKVLSIASPSQYIYPPTTETDTTVQVHDYQFLTLDRRLPLPVFPGASPSTFVSHGQFVFASNAGTSFYVIVQADSTSGLLKDFGIATITP